MQHHHAPQTYFSQQFSMGNGFWYAQACLTSLSGMIHICFSWTNCLMMDSQADDSFYFVRRWFIWAYHHALQEWQSSASLLQARLHQGAMGWSWRTGWKVCEWQPGCQELAGWSSEDCRTDGALQRSMFTYSFLTVPLQMECYWDAQTTTTTQEQSTAPDLPTPSSDLILRDFHLHCQLLAQWSDICDEEWQSELHCYLKHVETNVLPETDVMQWWQVCWFTHLILFHSFTYNNST